MAAATLIYSFDGLKNGIITNGVVRAFEVGLIDPSTKEES
jgi:hypothetical protein